MDPITHGVVGLASGTLSGQPFSMDNPVYWASLLGSQLPDFDIVCQLKGDYFYLKNHRGISHSLPGLAAGSLAGAALLSLLFPATPFWSMFFWILVGAFSHSFLDIFNSYGAQMLWPFSGRMVTANLLPLADPVLMVLSLGAIGLAAWGRGAGMLPLALFAVYLLLRWMMRRWAFRVLRKHLEDLGLNRLVVHPAVTGIRHWDFLAEGREAFVVGRIRLGLTVRILLRRRLVKEGDPELIQAALDTDVGRFFRRFTPHFYVTTEGRKVRFLDLRYFVRNDFLHHATAIFDEQSRLVESFFHPYHRERKVKIG